MSQTSYPNYFLELTLLRNNAGCLSNIKLPRLRKFFPHLEHSEIKLLTEQVADCGKKIVIGPPVKIIGAEHRFQLEKAVDGFNLTYAGVARQKASYAKTSVPDAWVNYASTEYRERVADFSLVNWSDQLIWDEGRFFMCVHIGPAMCAVVSLRHDPSFAGVEELVTHLIDRSVVTVATNFYEMQELSAFQNCFHFYFCPGCGGGVVRDKADTYCSFCRKSLTDLFGTASCNTTPFPLPMTITKLLNFDFEVYPLQANCDFMIRWAGKLLVYTPPCESPKERSRLIIMKEG